MIHDFSTNFQPQCYKYLSLLTDFFYKTSAIELVQLTMDNKFNMKDTWNLHFVNLNVK